MEDTRTRKKDIWEKITKAINSKGYIFSQSQVENKWRNLQYSHKNIVDGEKKTGAKRKTFQYFQEMEEILTKRHDIYPSYLNGSDYKSDADVSSGCNDNGLTDEKPQCKKLSKAYREPVVRAMQ